MWLAYSEELCTQAAEEFVQAWSHLGDRDVQLHRYWGGHVTDLDDVTDGIVIAGLTRTVRGAQRDIQPLLRLAGRTSLVVLDEAHQAVAETYSLVLDLLVNYRAGNGLLGLSATPGRTWNDPAQDRELADFFCSQKVTLEVQGYASPVDYLVAEGYLARPSYRSLTYSGGLQLTAQDLTDLQRSTDISDRILHLLADDEQRNLVIIMEVEGLLRKHSRVILFATTVEHANILSAVFRSRGVAARAISSNTPIPVRQRYIGEFKLPDETPRLLCNYGVLTTGFDAPATSAALIARPTKSLVLYSQMVGRAIRGVRAGGNPDAEIVTVVDTSLPGFGDLSQAFENWEDVLVSDSSLVPASLAVQAMRDNGYKNTAYAIAEIIDNSIQAGAKRVELICAEERELVATRERRRINAIGVIDNGSGMSRDELRRALQFGTAVA